MQRFSIRLRVHAALSNRLKAGEGKLEAGKFSQSRICAANSVQARQGWLHVRCHPLLGGLEADARGPKTTPKCDVCINRHPVVRRATPEGLLPAVAAPVGTWLDGSTQP